MHFKLSRARNYTEKTLNIYKPENDPWLTDYVHKRVYALSSCYSSPQGFSIIFHFSFPLNRIVDIVLKVKR